MDESKSKLEEIIDAHENKLKQARFWAHYEEVSKMFEEMYSGKVADLMSDPNPLLKANSNESLPAGTSLPGKNPEKT